MDRPPGDFRWPTAVDVVSSRQARWVAVFEEKNENVRKQRDFAAVQRDIEDLCDLRVNKRLGRMRPSWLEHGNRKRERVIAALPKSSAVEVVRGRHT